MSMNNRRVQADTDGINGAHHPVGPMVSALIRALSVSLRSSSIARLDRDINTKYQSESCGSGGNGAEVEDKRCHRTSRGSQERNHLIKREKTECGV